MNESQSEPPSLDCKICFNVQTIYSVGICDHPICYECSTTMRVLCDQKECPICRCLMTKVIFTKEVDLYQNLDTREYSLYYKKYGIAFEDHSVEYSFQQLIRCYCKKCNDRPDFEVFEQLASHMEQIHRLHACIICVKHLKIFPSQRRWYNNDELVRHKKCGDSDNTSHRGHPECPYCNIHYLDKDELYKHLRIDHFYCHFCDSDGINQSYGIYELLRKHFQDNHYLCEEGNCINEQFTSVFRSSIDLQAHKVQAHSKELGKHGLREARTLSLEFDLEPRHYPLVEPGPAYICSYQPPENPRSYHTYDPTIDGRNTSDFPSFNCQTPQEVFQWGPKRLKQSINKQDLNPFPALVQEPMPSSKLQKPINTNQITAATVLKKSVKPFKSDRNQDLAAKRVKQSINKQDLNPFPALVQEPMPSSKLQKPINTNQITAASVLKKSVKPFKSDRNQDLAAKRVKQSINKKDLNPFPALVQEPIPLPKLQKPINAKQITATSVLKKSVEPFKSDRNQDLAAISLSSHLPKQATKFSFHESDQKISVKRVTVSLDNSGNSWASKVKGENQSKQDENKKGKKEMAIEKKIVEDFIVPSSSGSPNLNKIMEANKSNKSKLGNKKKEENSKIICKNINNSILNENRKNKSLVQVAVENNNSKMTLHSSKSVDNNNENNKPKQKLSKVQYKSSALGRDVTKSIKCTAGKSEVNNPNKNIKASAKPKKEEPKNDKNKIAPLPKKPEETYIDAKEKRTKNKNVRKLPVSKLCRDNVIPSSFKRKSFKTTVSIFFLLLFLLTIIVYFFYL